MPKTVLHLANNEEFRWLLQPELKAINDGLTYGIKQGTYRLDDVWTYRGYLNAEGLPQGVGIKLIAHYEKKIGEWNQGKLHGTAKIECS